MTEHTLTEHTEGNPEPIETIGEDRAVALVRAREIPDAAALASALAAGGIRAVEFTFTTPGVLDHIAAAVESPAVVGAGTVLTVAHARDALAAGAQFLVTPGLSPAVAELGVAQGVPVLMGAFTPSEVMQAMELGAAAVKVFPRRDSWPDILQASAGSAPRRSTDRLRRDHKRQRQGIPGRRRVRGHRRLECDQRKRARGGGLGGDRRSGSPVCRFPLAVNL
jgi:Entner-Doudoroff aldolase